MIFGKRRRDPAWYAGWREEAFDTLSAKQARIAEEFRIGQWPRYDYNLETGRLTFSDEAKVMVTCEIQAVGTVGTSDWRWGWANAALPKTCTDQVLAVRAYGEEHGIDELASASVKAKNLEGLGWMLTAATARLLDAEGAYRPPNGLFLICRSLTLVS
jgi:hypothetical protein